jgi:hypothetical protein
VLVRQIESKFGQVGIVRRVPRNKENSVV